MDKAQVLVACVALAMLALQGSAWPYNGRRGNRRGNGGWTPGQVDSDGFGLSENCPAILTTASEELNDIAAEMPAHYKGLIQDLEAVFANDILDYPMEADVTLYDGIGELAIAAQSIESVAQIPLSAQCKRQLMVALKKLNTAITSGLAGLDKLEEALVGRGDLVPFEKLQEWIGAFAETLSVRNDVLNCFVTNAITPDGEGEGEGEGGDEGEIPTGGEGSQNPPVIP